MYAGIVARRRSCLPERPEHRRDRGVGMHASVRRIAAAATVLLVAAGCTTEPPPNGGRSLPGWTQAAALSVGQAPSDLGRTTAWTAHVEWSGAMDAAGGYRLYVVHNWDYDNPTVIATLGTGAEVDVMPGDIYTFAVEALGAAGSVTTCPWGDTSCEMLTSETTLPPNGAYVPAYSTVCRTRGFLLLRRGSAGQHDRRSAGRSRQVLVPTERAVSLLSDAGLGLDWHRLVPSVHRLLAHRHRRPQRVPSLPSRLPRAATGATQQERPLGRHHDLRHVRGNTAREHEERSERVGWRPGADRRDPADRPDRTAGTPRPLR